MTRARALIREHRRLAMAILVLAFCLKVLIPNGFMVAASADRLLTVSVCADASGTARTMDIVIPGKSEQDGPSSHDAKKDGHCAFSGLGKVALGGADPLLLALALTFILVLGLAPASRPPLARIAYLRPPLRGPPVFS